MEDFYLLNIIYCQMRIDKSNSKEGGSYGTMCKGKGDRSHL